MDTLVRRASREPRDGTVVVWFRATVSASTTSPPLRPGDRALAAFAARPRTVTSELAAT